MKENKETIYKQANFERYTNLSMVAAYLESEWSDFLFGAENDKSERDNNDPMTAIVQPNFYKRIAELAYSAARGAKISPKRYCDVGGATGRTLYEISRRFPDLAELVLVEPSPTFYKWAKRFLKGKDLGWIPRVGKFEKPTYVKPNRPPEPIGPPQKLYIHNVAAEEIPRPANYFDLITCLNVIDRHNNPPGLVKILGDLLAPNGLLILASPLDYMAEFTPDKKLWVDDLNQLFMETEAATKWKSIDDQNIVYDFHYYCRKITRFNSHTVIKQKIG